MQSFVADGEAGLRGWLDMHEQVFEPKPMRADQRGSRGSVAWPFCPWPWGLCTSGNAVEPRCGTCRAWVAPSCTAPEHFNLHLVIVQESPYMQCAIAHTLAKADEV